MLDILYAIFQTLIHGIVTIFKLVISIPKYMLTINGVVSLMPAYIAMPLSIILLASILIGIKRLVF